MIASLITFGGMAFWSLLAIYFLFITYVVNKEDSAFAPAFWSAIGVGAVVAFTDVSLPDFTLTNILIGITTYFSVGVVWAFGKWVYLVIQIRNFARDFKEGKVETNRYNEDDSLEVRAGKEFDPNDAVYQLSLPPKAKQFHTRITTWITYWPASMLATIIGDLIGPSIEFAFNIGARLARGVAGTFSRVSARIYGE